MRWPLISRVSALAVLVLIAALQVRRSRGEVVDASASPLAGNPTESATSQPVARPSGGGDTQPAGDASTAPVVSNASSSRDPVEALKNPAPWLNWGADFRLRWEYLDNAFNLSRETPEDEWSVQRFRPRAWATATPAPGVDFNLRMAWEGRHFCSPDNFEEWDTRDVLFDRLNLKVQIPDAPVTVTVGRQDIILGDGWLVLEGTPLDGSRTIFFDAARFRIELEEIETSADLVYIYQFSDTDTWLPPIESKHGPVMEQDERGAIVYVTNKSIDRMKLDAYSIYKRDHAELTNGDTGEIYTFGGRAAHDLSEHWKARTEHAGQFGNRNGSAMSAYGSTSGLSYHFNDDWHNQLKLGYEYLSGDDPNSSKNTAFDPLWGRWPQWSELYIYTWSSETRISEITNLHRLACGWQLEPVEDLDLFFDYHLLFADENTFPGRAGFSENGSFRGQLFTSLVRYRFNRFLSGHLHSEFLFPGSYQAEPRDDVAAFLRAELVFTF